MGLLYLVRDFSCYPNHVPLDFRLPIRALKTGGARPAGWLMQFMNEEQSESVNHRSVIKPSMKPKNPQSVRSLSTASFLVYHLREDRV